MQDQQVRSVSDTKSHTSGQEKDVEKDLCLTIHCIFTHTHWYTLQINTHTHTMITGVSNEGIAPLGECKTKQINKANQLNIKQIF